MGQKTFAEFTFGASELDSDYDIFQTTLEIMNNWKPRSEVMWQTYSRTVAAITASASGLTVNHLLRQQMQMKGMGVIVPVLAFGGIIPMWYYAKYPHVVLKDLYVWQNNCSVCIETKASLIQCGFAIVYPIIASPLVNISAAINTGLNIPAFDTFRTTLQYIGKCMKPMLPKLLLLCLFNGVLGAGLVNRQAVEIANIHMMIKEAGEMMEEERAMIQAKRLAEKL